MNISSVWAFVSTIFSPPFEEAEPCPEPQPEPEPQSGSANGLQEFYYIGMEKCPQGAGNCSKAVGRCLAPLVQKTFPTLFAKKAHVPRVRSNFHPGDIIPFFALDPKAERRKFLQKGGALVEDRVKAQEAVEYIHSQLMCGLPVRVAVSYLNQKQHQKDGATDHYVLVTGWRKKVDGTIVLTAIDPATSSADKAAIEFNVDTKTWMVEKKPDVKGKWLTTREGLPNKRHYWLTFVVRATELVEEMCDQRKKVRLAQDDNTFGPPNSM